LLQHVLQLQESSDLQGAGRQALSDQWVMVEGLTQELAASQIKLFKSMATVWPTSLSSSEAAELGSAALPVLKLALVLLESSAGRAAYVLEVMDFVACVCDSLLPDLRHTGASPAAGGVAASSGSSSSSGAVPLSPDVQQLLQSEQLPKLLATTQALYVLALSPTSSSQDGDSPPANSSSGSAAASSQRLSTSSSSGSSSSSVPYNGGVAQQGAEQLLVTTFSSWDGEVITRTIERHGGLHLHWQREHGEGRTAAALLSIAAVVQHMLPIWAAARTGSSSSCGHAASASLAASAEQSAQQRHQQYMPLLVLVAQLRHWALVQAQLMQLVDSVACKADLMTALVVMLDAAETVGARLHMAVKQVLLQPVLQQLLPHLQGVLGTQPEAAAPISSSSRDAAGVSGHAAPSSSSSGSSSSNVGGKPGSICSTGSSSSSSVTHVALELWLSTLLMELAQGGEASVIPYNQASDLLRLVS
jgi:hypothetical protein